MSSKGTVLFVSKRRDAASTRYRIFQYWPYLEKAGWSLDYYPAGSGRLGLLKKARRADIAVIQRRLFDAFTIQVLKLFNPRIIFDFDDAIFLNDDGSPSRRRRKRFDRITRAASLCLAGNRYLAGESRCERTVVFPTTVELSRYRNLQVDRPEPPPLTLVWIGSRSTRRYLEQHRPILEAIGRELPELELKVIGDFRIDFSPLSTRCIAWSAETEVRELGRAHVGIAPMSDDPWTRGKCALKVIQYMACGLPVVSSDCGANAEIVRDGETGFLASTEEQWIQALRQLQDRQQREAMGQAALQRVEARFSAEALAEKLNELLTETLNRPA